MASRNVQCLFLMIVIQQIFLEYLYKPGTLLSSWNTSAIKTDKYPYSPGASFLEEIMKYDFGHSLII